MADADKSEGDTPDPMAALQPQPPAEPVPIPEPASRSGAPRRGGFVGGLLGGVIAAGAGFGVAQYVPNGWPLADTTALTAQMDRQAQQIEALTAQIAAPDTALQDRVAALEAKTAPDLSPFDTRLVALEQRLTAIEAMPMGDGASPAAMAAQDAALKTLQAEVLALKTAATPAAVQAITAKAEQQLQQAEAAAAQIKADAEAMAKTAETRTALGRLRAALDSGAPYAAILPALPDMPAVLSAHAETGLPTLAGLQDSFPAAARAALEAALRANMGESWSQRVTSFLRSQIGARSLEPREGTDPDAILSRAEAAVAVGDLTAALTEITALPAEAQPALADWRAMAEQRLAAVQAVADLATHIGE